MARLGIVETFSISIAPVQSRVASYKIIQVEKNKDLRANIKQCWQPRVGAREPRKRKRGARPATAPCACACLQPADARCRRRAQEPAQCEST
jgi:hypothetical protein